MPSFFDIMNAPAERIEQPASDLEPIDFRPFYSRPQVPTAQMISTLYAELAALKAKPLPATFGELLNMNEELQRITFEIDACRSQS